MDSQALVPSFDDLWLLPRMVGHRRALELLLTGEVLTAQRALELGVADRVCDDEASLELDVLALADQWAHGPAFAYQLLKREFYRGWDLTFESSLQAAASAEAPNVMTNDVREAFIAFAERRAPKFLGR